MFEGLSRKILGVDINDDGAMEVLVSRHIEKLTRAEAMRVIYGIREWADAYGQNTFGNNSWAEYCRRRDNGEV